MRKVIFEEVDGASIVLVKGDKPDWFPESIADLAFNTAFDGLVKAATHYKLRCNTIKFSIVEGRSGALGMCYFKRWRGKFWPTEITVNALALLMDQERTLLNTVPHEVSHAVAMIWQEGRRNAIGHGPSFYAVMETIFDLKPQNRYSDPPEGWPSSRKAYSERLALERKKHVIASEENSVAILQPEMRQYHLAAASGTPRVQSIEESQR